MDDATATGTAGFWIRMRRRKVVQWGIFHVLTKNEPDTRAGTP